MYPKKYLTSYLFMEKRTSEGSEWYEIYPRFRNNWNHSEPSVVPVFHKPVFWSVTFLGYTRYNKVALVEMSWSINYFLSCFSKSLVEGAESPLTRESPAGSLNKKNFVYNSRSEAALGTIHILRNHFLEGRGSKRSPKKGNPQKVNPKRSQKKVLQ